MNKVEIIGLGGTNGAGKDTVANLLADEYGYYFVNASDLFAAELAHRNWPPDREHKGMLSAEWRREHGMGVVVDKALEAYSRTSGYNGLVVGSLRHPGEADRVHELGGLLWWVDADPEIRYERIRKGNRGRGPEDDKTFEQFWVEEQREMTPTGDGATLNMSAVKERADKTIVNNSADLADLRIAVEAALGL
ncbi:MAG TPA: AAA family ATPase [Candidatus Saccharimonadales bacterium]|nr:AAA family ATPase [Candidatus Saccharimonadales bacterium]